MRGLHIGVGSGRNDFGQLLSEANAGEGRKGSASSSFTHRREEPRRGTQCTKLLQKRILFESQQST